MKYKIGDKVRIRPDLEVKGYGSESAVEEMTTFSGERVTISKVNTVDYSIEEDDGQFYWTDEMFEQTNADKIRYMTDDDLASWLYHVTDDVLNGSTWNEVEWLRWLKEVCE